MSKFYDYKTNKKHNKLKTIGIIHGMYYFSIEANEFTVV